MKILKDLFIRWSLALMAAGSVQAATVTWTGTSGVDTNWSTAANWSGGTPADNSVVFTNLGTKAAGVDSSVVDANHAVTSLNFAQQNATNHQLRIGSGIALTVTNAFTPSAGAATAVLFGVPNGGGTVANTTFVTGPGTLTVNNSAAHFLVGYVNASGSPTITANLSGLAALNATVSIFGVGRKGTTSANADRQQAGVLYLAKTNVIVASELSIGDTTGINGTSGTWNNGGGSTLYLGAGGTAVNTLRADTISMGVGKAAGNLYMASGATTNDTVTIRNKAGSGPVANMYVAYRDMSSSSGTPSGNIDFGAAKVDARFTTIDLGIWAATGSGNNISPSATFKTGSNALSAITITTLNIARASTGNAPTNSQTFNCTFTANGGTVIATNVNLATGNVVAYLTRTGTLTVDGGTFRFAAFGTPTSAYAINLNRGTLATVDATGRTLGLNYNLGKAGGGTTMTFGQASGGTGTLALNGTGTLLGNTTLETLKTTTLGGAVTGAYSVVKTGGAQLTVNQNQTFSGGLTIQEGSVKMSSAKTLASGINVEVGSGAFWYLDGSSQTVGQLTGAGTIDSTYAVAGTDTLTVGSGDASSQFDGVIKQSTARTYALTKTGTGTFTLNGTNAYTGATAVNAGTLLVNGSISTGTVTVAAAGTLGGTGVVAGAVVSAGTNAPGVNGAGSLSVASFTQQAAGNLASVLSAGPANTALNCSGPAVLGGGLLVATNDYSPAFGDAFTVLTASAVSGVFATTSLPPISPALEWRVTYSSTAVVVGVTTAQSAIAVSGSLAFGNVATGQTANAALVIANQGTLPFTVTNIVYPAGYSGSWTGTVSGGASSNVTVTFAPLALASYDGVITVESDANEGAGTIAVTGTGAVSTISLSGSLAFGNVRTGATANATLTIANSGGVALAVTNISYPAGFSGAWTGAVAAGAATNVTVTFAPETAMAYVGLVTVESDALGGDNTLAASGTGVVATIDVTGSLAFGNVATGLTATATLVVANIGGAPLTVTNIAYPEGFSGAWTGVLAVGVATNVTVTFAPLVLSNYSGIVAVQSDAQAGSNTVTATGTGVAGIIGVAGNLDFGDVLTGTTTSALLTVTNSGLHAFTVTNIVYPSGFGGDWTGTVAAGSATNVEVLFAPIAVASYGGTIEVQSDAPAGSGSIACSGAGVSPLSGYDLYASGITNAADAGYQDDADDDGYANLLEYVTGGNVTNSDTVAQMGGTRTNGLLALTFKHDTNTVDATLVVEGSDAVVNDASWLGIATNLNGSWGAATNVVEDTSSQPATVTVTDNVAGTNRFLRLRVSRP